MNIKEYSIHEHEAGHQASAVRRIRWTLAQRPAMHIDELCMRLGLKEDGARAALQRMRDSGEVELLRPVDCLTGGHDFFRLCGGGASRNACREIGRSACANKPDDYVLAGIVG
jgi:hypothetical protein